MRYTTSLVRMTVPVFGSRATANWLPGVWPGARMISKLWEELEREIRKHRLSDRTIFALSDAAMGYRIRSSHYRRIADVSGVVASRDLRAIVNAGLLVAKGERRGRLYVATKYLRLLAQKIRETEPKDIGDPFVSGVMLIA